jgi:protein-disulfide isomerase
VKIRTWLAPLAITAALGGAAAVADAQARRPAARTAAQRDWTRTVVATPQGGFRMGNPNAPVKLVEYGSLTCPHCAAFSVTGSTGVAARVRTGKLSFEFRNMVLNGADVAVSLVARCAPPQNFFRLTERLYATQQQWLPRLSGMTQAQQDQLKALPDQQKFGRMAEIAGIGPLAAQAGVPPQKAKACLASKPAVDRLVGMYEAANAMGVQRTPTFFVNGTKVEADTWAELQPIILKAGG